MFVLTTQKRRTSELKAFWTFRGLIQAMAYRSNWTRASIFRIGYVRTLSKKRAIQEAEAGNCSEIFIKRYKGHSKKAQDLVTVTEGAK